MPYVERDGGGKVVGRYARPQPGTATEFLADNHADLQPTFEDKRTTKMEAIDTKTTTLLEGGFSHAGKVFSMTDNGQRKVVEYAHLDANQFPKSVSAMDESKYSIPNQGDMVQMRKAMIERIASITSDGSDLKQDCLDAIDQTALDAVVDNRT